MTEAFERVDWDSFCKTKKDLHSAVSRLDNLSYLLFEAQTSQISFHPYGSERPFAEEDNRNRLKEIKSYILDISDGIAEITTYYDQMVNLIYGGSGEDQD